MDEKLDMLGERLDELLEKLEELSAKIDNVESAAEDGAENGAYSAVEDAMPNLNAGQSPLITVFSQDKKFIVPVYSLEARREKKDQDPFLIMAYTTPVGNTRVIGRYPNKESALSEMQKLANAVNLDALNGRQIYEIK